MRTHSQKMLSPMSSASSLSLRPLRRTSQFRFQKLLVLAMFALLSCVPVFARLHHYNKVVVFGDSLSDTGNAFNLFVKDCGIAFPAPFPYDYALGRFTDGYGTLPSAESYSGVWIQQLVKDFPNKPPVVASLDGGTNYAYGDALTGNGTNPLPIPTLFGTTCSVQVANMGQQISDYLNSHPTIGERTLFVVWGGANNVFEALLDNTPSDIIIAANEETADIQRLIQAGATQILVPNLPPLGLVPRLNGSPTTVTVGDTAAQTYNTALAMGISQLKTVYSHVSFYQLDVYGLMTQVVNSPGKYSLTNVTTPAQGQPVDPDDYLFWDTIHPTTAGHHIMADAALQLLSK
jgi:phospholipase/lecithinase/hemolysin